MTGTRAERRLALRHQRVQRLRRLARRRSARHSERAFVLEGAQLLSAALDAGAAVESVYLAPGAVDPVVERAAAAGIRVFELAPGVMERVADTATPQPVLAVAPHLDVTLAQLPGDGWPVLVCVDVRDPGNLGTVLRSAEASGAAGVICCDGSVDLYNPKCVRASAGSLFRTRVVAGGEPLEVLATLGSRGMRRLGTRAGEGDRYDLVDYRSTALVLGSEAHGLPPGLEAELDGWLTIPMVGRADSLNVGMTAAVLCFQAARQRAG